MNKKGQFTGLRLVSKDGTVWKLGKLIAVREDGYYGFQTYTYKATTTKKWAHDSVGKRKKVRSDMEASYCTEDPSEWSVDTLDGDWYVDALLATDSD
ncbi:MAG: hypothetical protein DRH30_02565 [Deltaproteobacteria bacterium]|nr:MAG: hypothetical protein DRH30_02565 [Deltaproteobacteria bacterium]